MRFRKWCDYVGLAIAAGFFLAYGAIALAR